MIYRLNLSDRAHHGQSLCDFQINWCHCIKKMGGEIINTPLASSAYILIMPGYESCGEEHKVCRNGVDVPFC